MEDIKESIKVLFIFATIFAATAIAKVAFGEIISFIVFSVAILFYVGSDV
jgi:hypothetical protein